MSSITLHPAGGSNEDFLQLYCEARWHRTKVEVSARSLRLRPRLDRGKHAFKRHALTSFHQIRSELLYCWDIPDSELLYCWDFPHSESILPLLGFFHLEDYVWIFSLGDDNVDLPMGPFSFRLRESKPSVAGIFPTRSPYYAVGISPFSPSI